MQISIRVVTQPSEKGFQGTITFSEKEKPLETKVLYSMVDNSSSLQGLPEFLFPLLPNLEESITGNIKILKFSNVAVALCSKYHLPQDIYNKLFSNPVP